MAFEGSPSQPSAEFIARLEAFRQSGIRVDAQGSFWHEEQRVEHEGFRQALFRWLDRLPPPDGRYVLRLDAERYAYLEVEDTPLVVRTLRWVEDLPVLSLSDGTEESLDASTLTIDENGVLRAWVHQGRLEARLSTAATSSLAVALSTEPAPLISLPHVPPQLIRPR